MSDRGAGALVTGEAVELELAVARLPSRLLALAIDLFVELVGFALVLGLLAGVSVDVDVDGALGAALVLALTVAALVGVPVAVETLSRGRSLGKLAMGLRVVRDDGGPTRFRHALVRGLFLFFVDLWVTSGFVGLVTTLVSRRGKRVGDLMAGTVVVRERVPVAARAVQGLVPMPPPLAGWAAAADLARLPDPLALTVRQYLARSAQLSGQARESLGASLAAQVAAFVAPPAPPGTPAEAYLAAVVAERSRRAWWASQGGAAGHGAGGYGAGGQPGWGTAPWGQPAGPPTPWGPAAPGPAAPGPGWAPPQGFPGAAGRPAGAPPAPAAGSTAAGDGPPQDLPHPSPPGGGFVAPS